MKSEKDFSYDDLSRREVRSLIFHVLYAMEGHDYQTSLESVVDDLNRGFEIDISQDSEVFKIVQAIIDAHDELDELIKPLLVNWRFERIGVATKLILRFALWELKNTKTAPTIIINEAIELSKCFAEEDAYRFVNGVLDRFIKNDQ